MSIDVGPVQRLSFDRRDSCLFCYYMLILESVGIFMLIMYAQVKPEKVIRELVKNNECKVNEVTRTSDSPLLDYERLYIEWGNTGGMRLRMKFSFFCDSPNEVKFFYDDGTSIPHWRSIVFNNGKDAFPPELREYLERNRDKLFNVEILPVIKEKARRAFGNESNWSIIVD